MIQKNALINQIETTKGEEMEELLRRYYVDEHLTQYQIAKELNVSYLTVIRWLKRAGIHSRKLVL